MEKNCDYRCRFACKLLFITLSLLWLYYYITYMLNAAWLWEYEGISLTTTSTSRLTVWLCNMLVMNILLKTVLEQTNTVHVICVYTVLTLFNGAFTREIKLKKIKIDSMDLCDRMIKNTRILPLEDSSSFPSKLAFFHTSPLLFSTPHLQD